MRLRSTPRPPTVAVGTAFAGEGEGGIESVVPQGGAALSYLGGIKSPLEEGQWWNSLIPVNAITMPYLSAVAMT